MPTAGKWVHCCQSQHPLQYGIGGAGTGEGVGDGAQGLGGLIPRQGEGLTQRHSACKRPWGGIPAALSSPAPCGL